MDANKIMVMNTSSVKETVLEECGCQFVSSSDFCWKPYTYTFMTELYDLNRINSVKSREYSQNRLSTKLDPEYVSQYEFAMKNGDVFPALAVFRDEANQELLSDGFHTHAAALRCETTQVKGIYLFSHPYAMTDVSPKFNVLGGNGVPPSEKIDKAVQLYMLKEKRGDVMPSRKEWAKGFRINEEKFNWYFRNAETKIELARSGVNVDAIKDGSSFDSISRVRKLDQAASIEIAKLAAQFQLRSKDVEGITADYLNPQYTATEKAGVIEKYRTQYINSTNNGKTLSKARKRGAEAIFKEALTKLANQSQKADEDKLKKYMADPDMRSAVNKIRNLLNRLMKV